MRRLLIILILSLVLIDLSYAQKPQAQKKKTGRIEKQKPKLSFDFTDSLIRDGLTKLYGDSILIYINNYLKDSALLKTFGKPSLKDVGEFVSTSYKLHIPEKPLGWTSDYEHLFTTKQIATLDSIMAKFETETTNEIVIVTINSGWTTKESFDSLILAIHNYWGVGKKGINNGIIIGLSAGLRRIRISNGYGIETKLSDKETKTIIDDTMIPLFKADNYFEGVQQGLLAIIRRLR